MNQPLPDPKFKPSEVDDLIRDFEKPLPPEHKEAIMEKLAQQRERFLKDRQAKSKENDQDYSL